MGERGPYKSPKDLLPNEKLRFTHDTKEPVTVTMDDKHERRLRELRELSREANRLLQEEIDERNLPFSTKRSHQEALRFVVQIRPEFFHSTEDKIQRYTGQDDQVTLFLHLTSDGRL